MDKLIFILAITMFAGTNSHAQQIRAEKNPVNDSAKSKAGFKQRAFSGIEEKKSSVEDANSSFVRDGKSTPLLSASDESNAPGKAMVSELMKIDYQNMPPDVQSKINDNKAGGKYLLEGVVKIFRIEIASCITDADQKSKLQFLLSKKGFIRSQFISRGLIQMMVEPEFDSANLKELMKEKGIQFNFINRSYSLKK